MTAIKLLVLLVLVALTVSVTYLSLHPGWYLFKSLRVIHSTIQIINTKLDFRDLEFILYKAEKEAGKHHKHGT